MNNIKKGASTALLCVATLSTLSIASGRQGIHASQLNQNQPSSELSWGNSQPIQKAVNNNPQSRIKISNNKAAQDSNKQRAINSVNNLERKFKNATAKNDITTDNINSYNQVKKTINQPTRNNIHTANNLNQRNSLRTSNNSKATVNGINNNKKVVNKHLHKNVNKINKHQGNNINSNLKKKLTKRHKHHSILRKLTHKVHKHHHKKNLPADAVVQTQQKSAKNVPHNYHYYLKQSWFTDGLSKKELKARHWIVKHESGGHWDILSYGHVCIGRFQLSPSLLGRKHGHINLNKRHQVKAADNYVATRYHSWKNAKTWWVAHRWY